MGSCTDLVATVINPLREMYSEAFALAPLTVFLDPARVQSSLTDDDTSLPEEVQYIFRMQVEEADVIVLNKIVHVVEDSSPEKYTLNSGDELVRELHRLNGLVNERLDA